MNSYLAERVICTEAKFLSQSIPQFRIVVYD